MPWRAKLDAVIAQVRFAEAFVLYCCSCCLVGCCNVHHGLVCFRVCGIRELLFRQLQVAGLAC